MIQDHIDRSKLLTNILGFIGDTSNVSGDCIVMLNKELDEIIAQLPEKAEATRRLLKEIKQFNRWACGDKYVDLFGMLPETYNPIYAKDISGECLDVLSVLPERVAAPIYSHQSYQGYQRFNVSSDSMYLSSFIAVTGTSKNVYKCLTIYKPIDFKAGEDLECDAWGYTNFIPEKYFNGKKRDHIYFPLTNDAKNYWKGKLVQIDGIEMARIELCYDKQVV